MKATVLIGDIIIGTGAGAIDGIEIPDDVPPGRLRIVQPEGEEPQVVDVADVTRFYIDDRGRKHLAQDDPSWQPLDCGWDASIVIENGAWRRAGQDDRLRELKDHAKAALGQRAELARERYITPGDGKSAVYSIKREEARTYRAQATPDPAQFPWMAARAARLKTTLAAVAAEWNAKSEAWETVGRRIEDAYEAAVEAVEAVTSSDTAEADINAIVEGVNWP